MRRRRVGDQGQIIHHARLAKHAFVYRQMKPHPAAIGNGAKTQGVERVRRRQVRHVEGDQRRLGVGLAGPGGDPLGKGEGRTVWRECVAQFVGELHRVLIEAIEALRGDAAGKIVRLGPRIEQGISRRELMDLIALGGAAPGEHALTHEVRDNARHQTRGGTSARHQIGLFPRALGIG